MVRLLDALFDTMGGDRTFAAGPHWPIGYAKADVQALPTEGVRTPTGGLKDYDTINFPRIS